jgi:site-specific DNA-adenine methylase
MVIYTKLLKGGQHNESMLKYRGGKSREIPLFEDIFPKISAHILSHF